MRNIFKYKVLIIMFLAFKLSAISAFAINAKVQAKIDTTHILIGDQVTMTFNIEQNKEAVVLLPKSTDSLVSKVEIVSVIKLDTTTTSAGKLNITAKYIITSFDSGDYVVSVPVVVKSGIQTDTLYTNPITLVVRNIPIKDPQKFFDIKTVMSYPITLKEILMYVLIALLVVGLVVLIVYIIRRRKNNKPLFKIQKPVEPPYVTAIRELEVLKTEKLWQQGLYKQYYSRTTEIVRAYIEHQFDIPAMESTSDELLHLVQDAGIAGDNDIDSLSKLLRLADLVKFAKAEPLPDENENSLTQASSFVNNTKPQVAEKQSDSAAFQQNN